MDNMIEVVVARGRCVHHGDEQGRMTVYNPGDRLMMNEAEATRLRQTGHLLLEDGSSYNFPISAQTMTNTPRPGDVGLMYQPGRYEPTTV